MVNLQIEDDEIVARFTDGYSPEIEAIIEARPKGRLTVKQKSLQWPKMDFLSRDEAAAWALSALARGVAYRRYSSCFDVPLQTWIIGHPPRGPPRQYGDNIARWFADEPPDTEYRLIIHCQVRRHDGLTLDDLFCTVHQANWLRLRHKRKGFVCLRRDIKPFLSRILYAYHKGPAAVSRIIEQTQRPYWTSTGEYSLRRPTDYETDRNP